MMKIYIVAVSVVCLISAIGATETLTVSGWKGQIADERQANGDLSLGTIQSSESYKSIIAAGPNRLPELLEPGHVNTGDALIAHSVTMAIGRIAHVSPVYYSSNGMVHPRGFPYATTPLPGFEDVAIDVTRPMPPVPGPQKYHQVASVYWSRQDELATTTTLAEHYRKLGADSNRVEKNQVAVNNALYEQLQSLGVFALPTLVKLSVEGNDYAFLEFLRVTGNPDYSRMYLSGNWTANAQKVRKEFPDDSLRKEIIRQWWNENAASFNSLTILSREITASL